jgi:predicted nucleic acid-binding protein
MARTDAPVVVADAGPLIHLDELAALDVLADFPEIWVPEDVWSEVALHRPQALRHGGIRLLRHEASSISARINAIAALYSLHRGERAALALCLEHSIGTLLTDDTAARLAATSLNLDTHGTLGLLIRSVRRGLRSPTEVLVLLNSIATRSTLHIRPSLLDDVIRQVQLEWNDPGA